MGAVSAVFFLLWQQGGIGTTSVGPVPAEVQVRVFKLVFFYIFITSGFLTFIGYLFLARKLLHPIERLTLQAEESAGGLQSLLFNSDSGEGFNRLSRALNHLMQRLRDEQQQLKVTVEALEKANAELRETQQEMIRTEKLVSIGRLSAGLAHEIGNPLSILSGYLELLQTGPPDEIQARDFLRRAGREAERMDTLLHRLLEFARSSAGDVQCCAMNELIRQCFDDLSCQPLFKGITVDLKFEAVSDRVMADPVQVRQVLLNCAVNAADAIHEQQSDGQGMIVARTRNVPADSAQEIPEKWLVIELQDNGAGIHEEHLPTLFDPFFTTKDAGKGTGLGLSVCYMIIKEMGGTIEAVGHPGQGATITIRLPSADCS
jgi:signal transduction histidine kinase